MEPLSPWSFKLLNSNFWDFGFGICVLVVCLCCWVGASTIARELCKSLPAKICAFIFIIGMCLLVGITSPVTPPRMKNAMARSDLEKLIWDWKRGDRFAVEKKLSDPKIQKYYESDDEFPSIEE